MNAVDPYVRRLRRLKWTILGLVALFLVALEAYYYFARGVPLVENMVAWLIGMVGAVVLIQIGFRVVENLQHSSQQEIAERKQAEEALTALNKTSQVIASTLNLDEVLTLVMAEARAILNAEGVSVLLADAASDELVFAAGAGPASEALVGTRMPATAGVAGWAFREVQPVLIHDTQGDPRFYDRIDALTDLTTHSLLAVPLKYKEKVIGVIEATNKADGTFGGHDLDLLSTLAGSATIAIENARLYEAVQQELTERKRAEEALQVAHQELEHYAQTLEELAQARTFELQVLYELSQQIGYTLNYDELVRLILEHLHRAVSYDAFASLLMIGERGEIFIQPTRPLSPSVREEIQERLVTTFTRMSDQPVDLERLKIRFLEEPASGETAPPIAHLGSAFQVPLIVGEEKEMVGLLFVGSEREEAFTEDHVRLLYTVANQASVSVQRLRALLVEEQRRLESLVENLPEGVLLLGADGHVVLANPAGQEYLALLADAGVGDVLTRVGKHLLGDLLAPPEGGIGHEVVLRGPPQRVFEVVAQPMEAGPQAGGWVVVVREITERKQAEEALHYRLEFEELIANISTLFIQLAPDAIDSGIDFALQAIGEFAAVDRSYVFVLSNDGTKMDNTHEWCAEGIASQVENRRELPVQRFPWCAERLNRLKVVYAPQLKPIYLPHVADLPPEARAEREFLESQAVQSLVAVPMVYSKSLVGFVGFESVRAERTWTEDIVALLRMAGDICVNALERKRAHKQIQASLQEKEVLLKEIHHRVKNNLQVISSLLDLQSGYIKDEQTRQMFKESRSRVRSMALIHERLYQAKDLARIDFAEYVQSLADSLFRSYRTRAGGVTLKVNVVDVLLDVDRAIPCGLIINELVSNGLKYGFPDGREGEICVELFSDSGKFTLVVRDNGVGFPKDLDFRKTDTLGLKLVTTLAKQLRGIIELHRDGGTEFKVRFAAPERKERA